MPRLQSSRKSLVICGALAIAATIMLVPRAESQINTSDITQIINQINNGSFDPTTIPGLTGTTTTPGTTTGTGTDTGTGTGTDTGTGTGDGTGTATGERVPQVIGSQFGSVTGGALAARRPGLWTQQAIAFRATGEPALSGDVPNEPGFFKDTFLQMFNVVIDSINNFLDTVNLGIALDPTLGGGTTGPTPIPNAATTGQGTSTPIQ